MPEEERPEPSEWYVETDEPVEIIISYEVPLKPKPHIVMELEKEK